MTTIDNATIMAKGQTALDNERKAEERKAAAKAAKAAYVNGKTMLDILKNPAVAYTYGDAEYTAYVCAADMLDKTDKRHTLGNGRQVTDAEMFALHLKKLVNYVAADAMRNIGANAPRLSRADGLKHVAAMAIMLGYADYKADNRDFEYIGIGMKKLNRDGDITISTAKKAVCALFRAKLNGVNVRVLINGGKVEFNAEYVKAQADAEKKAGKADAEKKESKKAGKKAGKKAEKKEN